MRVLWTGMALALVLVGGAVGHQLGTERVAAPTTFAAQPMPASSPSYPVIPVKVVPDDTYTALAPGIPLHPVLLGSAPFQVRVPVPRGWVRSDATAGEWRWYPAADKTDNVYFVRVRQVGANYDDVATAVGDRISALENADDVDHLVIQHRRRDRFVARYVAYEHRRVSFEGYLPRGDVAFLWIAVIGRASDRAGLSDLFDRMMASTKTSIS